MADLQNNLKTRETKLARFSVRKDQILEIRFKQDDYEIEVQDQLDILSCMAELTDNGNIAYAILVIPGLYGGITPEARAIEIFKNKAFQNQKAIAIVVHALHQRIVGNLYLKLKKTKPKYPYLLFSKEKDAEKWLLNHR